ncbi:MAG: alpha/beta hydrolase [Patescibacteria group bacterium]
MKKVYLIHGWDSHPDDGIFPWLREELEKRGLTVFALRMPEPLYPKIETWVSHLKEQIIPDENTILFGHSIGVQTVLRYIESLGVDQKIGGAVLLAGWFHVSDKAYEIDEDLKIARPWLDTPINWEKIKSHTDKFVGIFSDDDPLVLISNAKFFEENLGAKIIIETGKRHFQGRSGIKELPSALESILEIADSKA